MRQGVSEVEWNLQACYLKRGEPQVLRGVLRRKSEKVIIGECVERRVSEKKGLRRG